MTRQTIETMRMSCVLDQDHLHDEEDDEDEEDDSEDPHPLAYAVFDWWK